MERLPARPPPPSFDLELALRLVDVADAISLAHYESGELAVEQKPDLSPSDLR